MGYIKAWLQHNIHFETSIKHLSILMPPSFQVPVIVEDESLIYRFPYSYRPRTKRGQLNEHFLDPTPLISLLDCLPVQFIVVLPIHEIWRTEEFRFNEFVRKLDGFLPQLPRPYRYAIQLHNNNYLLPDYFECLRRHNVAHVMDSSTNYPVFTTDFGLMLGMESYLKTIHAVRCAVEDKKKLYVFIDDSARLNHLMELLNDDLKRLSPFRRSVAA